jgi:hypothetical protein
MLWFILGLVMGRMHLFSWIIMCHLYRKIFIQLFSCKISFRLNYTLTPSFLRDRAHESLSFSSLSKPVTFSPKTGYLTLVRYGAANFADRQVIISLFAIATFTREKVTGVTESLSQLWAYGVPFFLKKFENRGIRHRNKTTNPGSSTRVEV